MLGGPVERRINAFLAVFRQMQVALTRHPDVPNSASHREAAGVFIKTWTRSSTTRSSSRFNVPSTSRVLTISVFAARRSHVALDRPDQLWAGELAAIHRSLSKLDDRSAADASPESLAYRARSSGGSVSAAYFSAVVITFWPKRL